MCTFVLEKKISLHKGQRYPYIHNDLLLVSVADDRQTNSSKLEEKGEGGRRGRKREKEKEWENSPTASWEEK